MRVASNSFANDLVRHLQMLNRRQSTLQTQISSGQRIQDASDDPLAAQRVLGLRDDSAATDQYQKNIQTHQDFANVTAGSLQNLQKILNRVQEIAVSADDLASPEELKSKGIEVGELLKQAVQIANTQFRGEYIFSGTKGKVAAVSTTLDADKLIQAVTFDGNSSEAESEVAPGVSLSSRVPAENSSGAGTVGLFADSRSGADLFKHIIDLQNQLLNGDAATIQSTTNNDLKKDEENVLYHVAFNGALQSRLETASSTNKDQKLALEGDISKYADTDISQAIVRLSQQQTAYQATLQSAASMMNLSLLSYLR
jgi:flagellar hook-associated protein 3 FlgL